MSTLNADPTSNKGVNLTQQILEQGQRLRNAMVQSILNNDPLNTEVISNRSVQFSSEDDAARKMHVLNADEHRDVAVKRAVSTEDKHKFAAYVRGEPMSSEEEQKVLETFRTMSNAEICEATDRSFPSNNCGCDTCKAYYKHSLSCDFNHSSSILCKDTHKIPPLNLKAAQKDDGANKMSPEKPLFFSDNSRQHATILKYVDSLKVGVHSLLLNQEGNKKVYGSPVDKKVKLPVSINHTYFIEYHVPDVLLKRHPKSRSKVDCGLDSSNVIRMCSKKLQYEAVLFKQISLHEVTNLCELDLKNIFLKFQVRCRTLKQRKTNILGYAKFSIGSILESEDLVRNEEMPVLLNDDVPIVLGILRVSFQLGCGLLYFGKEFIDAIYANKENIGSDVSDEDEYEDCNAMVGEMRHENTEASLICTNNNGSYHEVVADKSNVTKKSAEREDDWKSSERNHSNKLGQQSQPKHASSEHKGPTVNLQMNKCDSSLVKKETDCDKQILFGFIYVSEAQFYRNYLNTFVKCQPFCQNDTVRSRLVCCNINPVYNFDQTIPIVYDDDLLNKLRDNSLLFEFYEKGYPDNLIGVSKVSLHQFYISYRNSRFLNYLRRNVLPVIGCDYWEPIADPNNGEICGKAEILVALGSDRQIRNLKNERGFDQEVVKAKQLVLDEVFLKTFLKPPPKPKVTYKKLIPSAQANKKKAPEPPSKPLDPDTAKSAKKIKKTQPPAEIDAEAWKIARKLKNPPFQVVDDSDLVEPERPAKAQPPAVKESNCRKRVKQIDIGTQSDLTMSELPKAAADQKPDTRNEQAITSLLSLLQQKQKNICVESATNTEDNVRIVKDRTGREFIAFSREIEKYITDADVTKCDLLDSFQNVLGNSNDTQDKSKECDDKSSFKAHVIVETALHLPSRKKCKAKKHRGRHSKHEEIFPSTYVTFETTEDMKRTPLVQHNKSPEWDFRCDVSLPVDLLNNNQKRLIFKVWKKSNSSSAEPNMQTDTVLGFAALDLGVLTAGLPNVSGWFNIIDFSGKCNGQIKISVTPLENISKSSMHKGTSLPELANPTASSFPGNDIMNVEIGALEDPGEVLHRTLKRKFVELDEISQRLRLRLSHVTNDESDTSNDDFADAFEKDINTLCVEEDYDMINFEDDAQKSGPQAADLGLLQIQNKNFIYRAGGEEAVLMASAQTAEAGTNSGKGKTVRSTADSAVCDAGNTDSDYSHLAETTSVSSVPSSRNTSYRLNVTGGNDVGSLDKQLIEGKQKIDTLLEKLSLLTHNDTGEAFSNRYVSGCSTKQDDTYLTRDALQNITGNIENANAVVIGNPVLLRDLESSSIGSTPALLTEGTDSQSANICTSSSSLLTQFSDCRRAPDGAGIMTDDKTDQTSTTQSSL